MTSNPDLIWRFTTDPLSEKVIRTAERTLGVEFPADYRECVRINHGGAPESAAFSVEAGPKGRETRNVGLLLTLDTRESENVVQASAELSGEGGLPALVIPIINDGDGRFVCLDYRHDPERKSPAIGFWSPETVVDDGLIPLATDFSAFLSMLHREA